MRRWFDIERDEVVTEEQLRAEYEEIKDEVEVDFEDYIWNCMTHQGGTLETIKG